ncbi:hypothetical protein HNY73_001516 [Argiope bruennichi]|uniref:Uncharacterized protein n=1 Tax=Argiope bruennichi TaxID=94029 RepID=A0A8T0G210_ARGBR|nr:hypothetical protein HNY73_001516 [Argiope bruennichi]
MLSDKFNILELLDLALRVPEVGAVNFNILHTVLTQLIIELQMEHLRPLCFIQDEVAAQAAITKGRLEDPLIKSRKSLRPTMDVTDIKGMLQTADLKKVGMEEILAPIVEDIATRVIEKKQSMQEDEELFTEESSSVDEKDTEEETESDVEIESAKYEPKDAGPKLEEEVKQQEEEPEDAVPKSEVKHQVEEAKDAVPKPEEEVKQQEGEPESKSKESELTISLPDLTKDKDLRDVTDEEKATEVLAVATEILEKTSDAPAAAKELLEGPPEVEAGKVATQALKALTKEDVFQADPANVVQEMWRAININRRMDGAEEGLRELSSIVDAMLDKLHEVETFMNENQSKFDELEDYFERIRKLESRCEFLQTKIDEANEFTRYEIERLEEVIEGLTKELELSREALKELQANYESLCERAAYKEDLEELRNAINEDMDARVKKLKRRLLKEIEGKTPPNFFVKDPPQGGSGKKLGKGHKRGREMWGCEKVKKEGYGSDKVSREELGRLLEPGFIDKFLEEQENLRTELDALKLTVADVDENLNSLITRIEEEILRDINQTFEEIKATIAEMKEKLDTLDADDINDSFARLEEQAEMIIKEIEAIRAAQEKFEKEAKTNFKKISKADLEVVMGKLDRSEFVSVMQDMEETIERLTITVKINVSFGVSPVKELLISSACKKYPGSIESGQEAIEKQESKDEKLPSIDVDEVPIPPPDKPRTQDIHQLPVLFANIRPQIGLAHEKRKSNIDKEVAEYFASRRLYPIGGEHTKTFPQQRGLTFTTIKDEVLLKGLNKRFYKGTVKETPAEKQKQPEQTTKHADTKNRTIPAGVVVKNVPASSRPDATVSVPKNKSKQNLLQSKSSASTAKETVEASAEQGAKTSDLNAEK